MEPTTELREDLRHEPARGIVYALPLCLAFWAVVAIILLRVI